MGSVGSHAYGFAAATLATMRQMGNTFSMGIVIMVMSLLIGKSEITAHNPGQFISTMSICFSVFALLCLGGIFASLARGNINRSQPA